LKQNLVGGSRSNPVGRSKCKPTRKGRVKKGKKEKKNGRKMEDWIKSKVVKHRISAQQREG